jgi:colanic acid/amylovoran biosynthesis glycosyltransferase
MGHPWLLWAKYLPVINNQPDIFHIQWAKGIEEWIFLKELTGTKLVLSLRGTHITNSPLSDKSIAESYRRCFPLVDGFHAVSKEISLEAEQYGAKHEKTRVIYSAVDLNAIQKYNKQIPASRNTTIQLISVGRMHWIKGYHYALDAVKVLLDKQVKVHYTIIGWGNQEELLFHVHDLGLSNDVTIINRIPHRMVLEKMQSSDLLVLPSVEEGIANVVLEAMAIGLPVLSSDCGGMKEVIRHGQNGYLFGNRDCADLVHKIDMWINANSETKEKIILQAQSDIRGNHSIERLGNEMSKYYDSVFNSVQDI